MTATCQQIVEQHQLDDFCQRCSTSSFIGFDTEFVSENRYRPELCLLQVATDDELVIVDTLKVKDIRPFWDVIVSGDQVTAVHAAREEFLFCYRACGAKPKHLFDMQLAAAFVGYEYPASYANLVNQITGNVVPKGETRTDWKRRPLTDRQIEYALGDVTFLRQMYDRINRQLEQAERSDWYSEEVDRWMDGLIRMETEPQWHRVSGASRLNRRSLAILRELWIMRNSEAESRNRSPRRVIPDDLLVELAKRGSAKSSSFKAIRGFENRVQRNLTRPIADAINRGIEVPKAQQPARLDRDRTVNLGLLGQYLSIVLNVVCRNQRIAPSLVGTSNDLRKLAAWRLGMNDIDETPALRIGWRAEIVGSAIEKALDGKISMKVDDPSSDLPLAIEEL